MNTQRTYIGINEQLALIPISTPTYAVTGVDEGEKWYACTAVAENE